MVLADSMDSDDVSEEGASDDDGGAGGYVGDGGDAWERLGWLQAEGPRALDRLYERQNTCLQQLFPSQETCRDANDDPLDREALYEELEQLESEQTETQDTVLALMDSIPELLGSAIWGVQDMEFLRQVQSQAQAQLAQLTLLQRELQLHKSLEDADNNNNNSNHMNNTKGKGRKKRQLADDVLLVELAVIEQPLPSALQLNAPSHRIHEPKGSLSTGSLSTESSDSDVYEEELDDEVDAQCDADGNPFGWLDDNSAASWDDYVVQLLASPLCPYSVIGKVHAFLVCEQSEEDADGNLETFYVESEPIAHAVLDEHTGMAVFPRLYERVQRQGLRALSSVTDAWPEYAYVGFSVEVEVAGAGVFRVCTSLESAYPCRLYGSNEEWLEAAAEMLWMDCVDYHIDQEEVSWNQLANVLQLHFVNSTMQDPMEPERPLARSDIEYLRSKFLPESEQRQVISQAVFFGPQLPASLSPHGASGSSNTGAGAAMDTQGLWPWFGQIVQMLRSRPDVHALWCKGALFGLVSRKDAMNALCSDSMEVPQAGRFLIRFSERNPGSLVVVYLDGDDQSDGLQVKNFLVSNDADLHELMARYPEFGQVLVVDPNGDNDAMQLVDKELMFAQDDTHELLAADSASSSSSSSSSSIGAKYNRVTLEYADLEFDDQEDGDGDGAVRLARLDEELVMVRSVELKTRMGKRLQRQLRDESRLLCSAAHGNVVRMYGYAMQENGKGDGARVHLVHAYEEDMQSLPSLMDAAVDEEDGGALDMVQVLRIAHGIACGMQHLVETCGKVHHGDLTADSVLVDRRDASHVKICEYGMARPTCLRYRAPEVMRGDGPGDKTDVYSFGLLLAEMINMETVFAEMEDDLEAANAATYDGLRPQLDSTRCPVLLESILQSCWSDDASQRPSFGQLVRYLHRLLRQAVVGAGGVDADKELRLAEDRLHDAEQTRRRAQLSLRYAENEREAFGRMSKQAEEDVDAYGAWTGQLEHNLEAFVAPYLIDIDTVRKLTLVEEDEVERVYTGVWKGTPVRVKELCSIAAHNDDDALVHTFEMEVSRMSKLRHDNLTLFLGACIDESAHRLCLVTEQLRGYVNLETLLGSSEPAQRRMVRQQSVAIVRGVVRALRHMHLSKPAFVCGSVTARQVWLRLDDSQTRVLAVKVDPFVGQHILLEHGRMAQDAHATESVLELAEPGSLAPELLEAMVLQRDGDEGDLDVWRRPLDRASDVWSVAMLIWRMLAGGEDILQPHSVDQHVEWILHDGWRPQVPQHESQQLDDLLHACWADRADERPTVDQLATKLRTLRLPNESKS